MTWLIRPLVSALLCGILVVGHAPAWLHVAGCGVSCDTHMAASCATAKDGVNASIPHHHCLGCQHQRVDRCSQYSAAPSDQAGPSQQSPCGPLDHHDHDRCSICQSLASPCGFTYVAGVQLARARVIQHTDLLFETVVLSTFLVVAAPRGPPVVA